MRFLIVLAALAALTACGRKEPEPSVDTAAMRNRSVPIGSPALFDADAFMGEWHVIARMPEAGIPSCPAIIEFARQGQGFAIAEGCAGGNAYRSFSGPMSLPGRFETDPKVWVLWVAQDGGAAVIGRPDGSMGMILSREAGLGADRFNAAREMLDFNGYDVSRLLR